MPTHLHTVYAVDPASRAVRAVLQIDADTWLDSEIEPMLAELVRACEAARLPLAFAVSVDSSFVLRRDPDSAQFEIDEIETSELLSPHTLHPDGARLADAVVAWCTDAAKGESSFLTMARLPRRVPELAQVLRGAAFESRQGAAQPLSTLD